MFTKILKKKSVFTGLNMTQSTITANNKLMSHFLDSQFSKDYLSKKAAKFRKQEKCLPVADNHHVRDKQERDKDKDQDQAQHIRPYRLPKLLVTDNKTEKTNNKINDKLVLKNFHMTEIKNLKNNLSNELDQLLEMKSELYLSDISEYTTKPENNIYNIRKKSANSLRKLDSRWVWNQELQRLDYRPSLNTSKDLVYRERENESQSRINGLKEIKFPEHVCDLKKLRNNEIPVKDFNYKVRKLTSSASLANLAMKEENSKSKIEKHQPRPISTFLRPSELEPIEYQNETELKETRRENSLKMNDDKQVDRLNDRKYNLIVRLPNFP